MKQRFLLPARRELIEAVQYYNAQRIRSAAGFTIFLILMFAILLMTEEFRVMMRPDTLTFFGEYFTGASVIVGLAIVGVLLLMTNNNGAEQNTTVGAQGSRR